MVEKPSIWILNIFRELRNRNRIWKRFLLEATDFFVERGAAPL